MGGARRLGYTQTPATSVTPMDATLPIILPVFGLILLGYAMGRTPLITKAGVAGINNFVFYCAIPALLFRTMSKLENLENADPVIFLVYYLPVFLLFGLTWLLARHVFHLPAQERAMMAMGASFSNTVLLGLALIQFAYGERGLVPLTLIISIHPIVLIAIPTILIEVARAGEGEAANTGFWTTVWTIARSLLKNPPVVGMAAGALWGLSGFGFHPIAERFIGLLANVAAPAALFALGATLVQFRVRGDFSQTAAMTALKLLALPALVFVSARYVFQLEPLFVAVATINASMPSGVNVFLLAAHYKIYLQRAAATVLLTTALSIFVAALVMDRFVHLTGP